MDPFISVKYVCIRSHQDNVQERLNLLNCHQSVSENTIFILMTFSKVYLRESDFLVVLFLAARHQVLKSW